MKELPAKLGTLLLELPNLIYLEITASAPSDDSASIAGALKTLRASFASLQVLTIEDDSWRFIIQLCPNLQELTIKDRSFVPRQSLSTLLETLGKTHPQLKGLHWPVPCQRQYINGKFDILQHIVFLIIN